MQKDNGMQFTFIWMRVNRILSCSLGIVTCNNRNSVRLIETRASILMETNDVHVKKNYDILHFTWLHKSNSLLFMCRIIYRARVLPVVFFVFSGTWLPNGFLNDLTITNCVDIDFVLTIEASESEKKTMKPTLCHRVTRATSNHYAPGLCAFSSVNCEVLHWQKVSMCSVANV